MAQTSNYGLGKPDPTTTVAEEIERLITTWDQLDLILKTLADAIATKAAANHNQAIGTITGLTEALAGKMAASKTFAVADLTDVSGSVEAALGYVLAKTALGFSFQSAASLLGNHQHGVADIVGLAAAIDAKIAALVAASPATLDTLAELAAALGNDPNFATTMAAQIADAARLTTGTVADARLPVRLQNGSALSLVDQPDAEAGAENTKAMTALRTKQQIDARFATYVSAEISIVTSSVTTLTHGLGAGPKHVNAYLLCKTAELGYSVGAKVGLAPTTIYIGAGAQSGVMLSRPGATTIDVTVANNLPFITPRAGVGPAFITAANWRIIVEASL